MFANSAFVVCDALRGNVPLILKVCNTVCTMQNIFSNFYVLHIFTHLNSMSKNFNCNDESRI